MKIVLNVRDLDTGGAERVAVLLAYGLRDLGHSVVIAACKVKRWDLLEGISVIEMDVAKPLVQAIALARIVNRQRSDVVIAFGVNPAIGASISRLFWRKRCQLIFRNENNLDAEWRQAGRINQFIGPALSRWAARRACMVAVSQSLADATSSYLKISRERVTTILNPVFENCSNSTHTMDEAMHAWLRDSAIPTFVAMGRLEYQKGFDVLIDAFSLLCRQAQARLVIFGKGSLQAALQVQINANGLQDTVTLAGHTENPFIQLRAAQAFVLSSRFEGFGLVLVEALRAGAQVISTDCNYGPSEVLENGRYGMLVPVGDPQSLANAMLRSLECPPATERPPDAWFQKFTAIEAARQHVALIESLA